MHEVVKHGSIYLIHNQPTVSLRQVFMVASTHPDEPKETFTALYRRMLEVMTGAADCPVGEATYVRRRKRGFGCNTTEHPGNYPAHQILYAKSGSNHTATFPAMSDLLLASDPIEVQIPLVSTHEWKFALTPEKKKDCVWTNAPPIKFKLWVSGSGIDIDKSVATAWNSHWQSYGSSPAPYEFFEHFRGTLKLKAPTLLKRFIKKPTNSLSLPFYGTVNVKWCKIKGKGNNQVLVVLKEAPSDPRVHPAIQFSFGYRKTFYRIGEQYYIDGHLHGEEVPMKDLEPVNDNLLHRRCERAIKRYVRRV